MGYHGVLCLYRLRESHFGFVCMNTSQWRELKDEDNFCYTNSIVNINIIV